MFFLSLATRAVLTVAQLQHTGSKNSLDFETLFPTACDFFLEL